MPSFSTKVDISYMCWTNTTFLQIRSATIACGGEGLKRRGLKLKMAVGRVYLLLINETEERD